MGSFCDFSRDVSGIESDMTLLLSVLTSSILLGGGAIDSVMAGGFTLVGKSAGASLQAVSSMRQLKLRINIFFIKPPEKISHRSGGISFTYLLKCNITGIPRETSVPASYAVQMNIFSCEQGRIHRE